MRAARFAGSKLIFLDLEADGHTIQVICNKGRFHSSDENGDEFSTLRKTVRRGDWYGERICSMTGGEGSVD